jgi:hypothetical protein
MAHSPIPGPPTEHLGICLAWGRQRPDRAAGVSGEAETAPASRWASPPRRARPVARRGAVRISRSNMARQPLGERIAGHHAGPSMIAPILRAHGISPVPERPTSWQTFLRAHRDEMRSRLLFSSDRRLDLVRLALSLELASARPAIERSPLPLLFNPLQRFRAVLCHLHQPQVGRPHELLSHRVVEKSQEEIIVAIRID